MHNEEEENTMKAEEMFSLLVYESKKMLEILNEEIKNNGTNDDIENLKKYLSEIYVVGNKLVLPTFGGWPTTNNKIKIAVYVTKYIYELKTLTKAIYKERRKSKTAGRIFNMAMDMELRYERYIIEELE